MCACVGDRATLSTRVSHHCWSFRAMAPLYCPYAGSWTTTTATSPPPCRGCRWLWCPSERGPPRSQLRAWGCHMARCPRFGCCTAEALVGRALCRWTPPTLRCRLRPWRLPGVERLRPLVRRTLAPADPGLLPSTSTSTSANLPHRHAHTYTHVHTQTHTGEAERSEGFLWISTQCTAVPRL